MQAWYHCENVYPFVPQEVLDRAESVRASLPNRYCDPKIAADLFHECLDEHLLCDDLGVNIISIEHHSGINSLYGASTMILGIIARQTKNVRILSLGTLVSVRPDPVRIKLIGTQMRYLVLESRPLLRGRFQVFLCNPQFLCNAHPGAQPTVAPTGEPVSSSTVANTFGIARYAPIDSRLRAGWTTRRSSSRWICS